MVIEYGHKSLFVSRVINKQENDSVKSKIQSSHRNADKKNYNLIPIENWITDNPPQAIEQPPGASFDCLNKSW